MRPSATQSATVSIVTPSYNQGRYIRATLDSILAQDYPAIEHIVVDGGSTDETIEILKSYGDRIRWISEPDSGQADAIDKGLLQTSGEIVAWLNADDVYLPGAVTAAMEVLRANPELAAVYGDAEFIDDRGAYIRPCDQVEDYDPDRLVHVLDYIVQPATFFRRASYLSAGGLDHGLQYCLDYDLWIRMGRVAPLRRLPRRLAQVRIHPDTKTASGGLPRLLEIEQMIRRHGRSSLPTGFQREMMREALDALPAAIRAGRVREAFGLGRHAGRYAARIAVRRLSRPGTRPGTRPA